MNNTIIVLDFGSQYTQLIARRLREQGVYTEILPFNVKVDEIKAKKPKGIILSGGPASVYAPDAYFCDEGVFKLKLPILGICYGMQTMAMQLGGLTETSDHREFGYASVLMENATALLPLQTPNGYTVQFEQVNFSYDADKVTLKNIDFSVPQNSFTAIIGTSGSGKTTLLNLLLRFWDVDSGKITLGGADIRHMEQDQLMKYCSVVFQDNFLFSCSIAENIAYGIENVTEEAIINAAKQARIHDFIMTLPEQYQTKVGERGQLLSGGQKQRISIARAFLQNRPILLLDEPTAFSDAKNEADLMRAFHALMQNKTVIMVAHRLSSITQADQIIYLENGKIIAQGNHQALLQTNAAYQTLWAEYQQAKSWTIH